MQHVCSGATCNSLAYSRYDYNFTGSSSGRSYATGFLAFPISALTPRYQLQLTTNTTVDNIIVSINHIIVGL